MGAWRLQWSEQGHVSCLGVNPILTIPHRDRLTCRKLAQVTQFAGLFPCQFEHHLPLLRRDFAH